MQTTPPMNWGRETSPSPCTPRNEQNLPKIRSLLHVAPTSQNDQPQQTKRKLPMPTVQTSGQSLSKSRRSAKFLNSYEPQREQYCFLPTRGRARHLLRNESGAHWLDELCRWRSLLRSLLLVRCSQRIIVGINDED